MSEFSQEPAVRLGPAISNVAKSIWRQRRLVALGVVLGLLLGVYVLPRLLSGKPTYEATVRLEVARSAADSIINPTPAFGAPEGEVASPDLLKDIGTAEQVLRDLGPAAGDLTATMLLDQLTVEPVTGSTLVDLTYTASDGELARAVASGYAKRFAERRNAAEQQRLAQAIRRLQDQVERIRNEIAQLRAAGADPTLRSLANDRLAEAQRRLDEARTQATLLGNPTEVRGEAIVAQTGTPVSRGISVMLGLILGVATGVGVGLLRETLSPKVLTKEDAEEASGLPFVASVGRGGMRRTSLPVAERPFSPAAEDYRRVATALERQGLGTDVKVLAITSADPKEGKTCLAANLAHALTRQGRDVVLVSSDLRRPHIERLFGLRPRAGLAEALADETTNVVALLVSLNDHLLLLPAGLPSRHPGELLASRRLGEILDALRRVGAIVILDTPPVRWSADAVTLATVADATLLVARSGFTRWRALEEATDGLRRDRLRQLGVVLVGTGGMVARAMAIRYGAYPTADAAPPPSNRARRFLWRQPPPLSAPAPSQPPAPDLDGDPTQPLPASRGSQLAGAPAPGNGLPPAGAAKEEQAPRPR